MASGYYDSGMYVRPLKDTLIIKNIFFNLFWKLTQKLVDDITDRNIFMNIDLLQQCLRCKPDPATLIRFLFLALNQRGDEILHFQRA